MALGRIYTGAHAPSRRRPVAEMRDYLGKHAHRIKYLCLHGFLAVDGVEYVIRTRLKLAADADGFILDLHQVDGISERAATLLNEARCGFAKDGIAVMFSRIHARHTIASPMKKAVTRGDRGYLSFEDNDLAVEWCENRLFGKSVESAETPTTYPSLANFSLFKGVPTDLTEAIEAACTLQWFEPGDAVLTAGQAGDGRVFFIESGQVSVLVPLDDGAHHRITSLGPGMNFGEMVLLGQAIRSATVCADTKVRCRILESQDLEKIAATSPILKIIVLENLASDLANSLRRARQWIAALA